VISWNFQKSISKRDGVVNMDMLYEKLEKYYEDSSGKFSEMSVTPEGVRYLKIRTLIDVEPLKASNKLKYFLQKSLKISVSRRINRQLVNEIRKKIFFNEKISQREIDDLLKKVYLELRCYRYKYIDFEKVKRSVSKIAKEGDEYWEAWKGVYRDDIRQHIQHHFVRTVLIQSYDELLDKIDKELNPIVKGYVIISWYNQWCSTIIEDYILTHPNVVPTARRIDKVDFFFLDIPFDLKITFVPDGFIKQSIKEGFISNPEDIVEDIKTNPERLIKWLYENQGEQRFSDSHRLFIVLADKNNLEDSWKLKACFDLIQREIDNFLKTCKSKDDIMMVEWKFEGNKIKGNYRTYSHLILIES
jgi:hypothetical protein